MFKMEILTLITEKSMCCVNYRVGKFNREAEFCGTSRPINEKEEPSGQALHQSQALPKYLFLLDWCW